MKPILGDSGSRSQSSSLALLFHVFMSALTVIYKWRSIEEWGGGGGRGGGGGARECGLPVICTRTGVCCFTLASKHEMYVYSQYIVYMQ